MLDIQFHRQDDNGEQRGEQTEEQNGEGSGERNLRQNKEANKEVSENKTEEEDEFKQSSKDGMERHVNDEIANMEEKEVKRKRDRKTYWKLFYDLYDFASCI